MKKNKRNNKRNHTQPMTIGQRFTATEIEALKQKLQNKKGKSK